MIIGGALGMGGVAIPCVEQGIAASVLVLGIFIAAAVRLPLPAGLGIVGLFAVFHGYAHGAEMPGATNGLTYAAGFVMATISLLLCGIGLGNAARKSVMVPWLRFAGGVIAVCGAYFCIAS